MTLFLLRSWQNAINLKQLIMGILDIILAIPIVWLAYRGFSKGLILSVTSLVALIAGIYFSIHFSGFVTDWLRNDLGWESEYINIAAFIITFVVVVVIIQLIGRMFNQVADWAALGALNRVGGLILGLVKAALFLGILLFIINSFDVNRKLLTDKMRTESYLYEPLSLVVPGIWPTVKGWLPARFEEEEDKLPGFIV
jgi:membrane protein required for colicin V production